MALSAKALAQKFGTGGWCHVYLEPRSAQARSRLKALLGKIDASDMEDLTSDILTARVPVERVEDLEKLAVVTPIDSKNPL
jgi:hypothetical protein